MVASRFLRRLDAFVGEAHAKAMRQRGQYLLDAVTRSTTVRPSPPRRGPTPARVPSSSRNRSRSPRSAR